MTPDNPLGIMYLASDPSGCLALGFASFRVQNETSPSSEWSEILSEILASGKTPFMLRCANQSEFLDAAKHVPA